MSGATVEARRRNRVLLVASLVSCLVMLDTNIVAVALPSIAASFHADFADMQWVVTAYMLPFAALLLAAGSLADIMGRKRTVITGQAIFVVASVLCGTSTSPLMLNLARAAQGVGASLLLTSALAVINHTFQGPERARAYGVWGACIGIAITSGPIVGGLISSAFGWHWAFLINLPIGVLLITASSRVIDESSDADAKRLDYAGVLTFSSGLFFIIWAAIEGNSLGWTSSTIVQRLVGGVTLLAAFVVVERLQTRPMMDFGLFRSGAFTGSGFAMIGYAAGAQVMLFYLPLFLQNTYGFSAAAAGLAMLPFALPMFLVPRVGARLAAHVSSRTLLCIGMGLSVGANAAMAGLATHAVAYATFAVAMALAGTGAGLLNGETAKAMQSAVPPQRAGMASGASGTTRFMGLMFGVAGLGAVLAATTNAHFIAVAPQWGLDGTTALALARRFAAGDAHGVILSLPTGIRDAAGTALGQAFDAGFSAAAWTAAGVSCVALAMTRLLMPDVAATPARAGMPLAAPGE